MGITERIDAITAIPAEALREDPPCPRSLKIELTARCNFACSFCARSHKLRPQGDMDKELFKALVREIREAGVEELGLFYLGESFLVPWLDDAVRYAKRHVGFPYVFLTTNGTLATPETVQSCMEAGLDSLKFSLNYADEDQFADIAGVKPSLYHVMLDNIRQAKRIRDDGGYTCGLYASFIEYDGDQGERMKSAVAAIEPFVDQVYALPLYNQASLVTEEELARGWQPTPGNRGRADALRDPLPCWAVFSEGHITADGNLSACCFDHDGRFHMGDLTKTSFMEAWLSPEFQALRSAHMACDVSNTVCNGCIAYQ